MLQKQSILGHSSPKKLKVILTGSSLAGSTVSVRPFGSDDISFYDSLFCIEPVYSTKHDYARLHSGEIYRESEVRCEHKNQR